MGLRVVYYEASHEPAARAFNARMRAADAVLFALPETAPARNPSAPVPAVEFRRFVVVDDAGEVRGGYFIRNQPFYIRGQVYGVGHYQAPLSEGIVDKRYAVVGAAMLAHALAEQPLLFAMGMGGMDRLFVASVCFGTITRATVMNGYLTPSHTWVASSISSGGISAI